MCTAMHPSIAIIEIVLKSILLNVWYIHSLTSVIPDADLGDHRELQVILTWATNALILLLHCCQTFLFKQSKFYTYLFDNCSQRRKVMAFRFQNRWTFAKHLSNYPCDNELSCVSTLMISLCSKSMDGFNYGTSWMTGCSGLFPASHVERTADAETWTLHKWADLLCNVNRYT